jgi:hypothetical protein
VGEDRFVDTGGFAIFHVQLVWGCIMSWFEVDAEGYRKAIVGRGLSRLLMENISNAFDANCKTLDVTIKRRARSRLCEVTFEDDGEGFSDIKLAYTFFADTDRRADPTKRGRFTVGEKNVLVMTSKAAIESRNKRLAFDKKGRHLGTLRKPRQGTLVKVLLHMSLDDEQSVLERLKQVHVPSGVTYRVYGSPVLSPLPIKSFVATLDTPIRVKDGSMRIRSRATEVRLYQGTTSLDSGVGGYLFELGIPVQPIACAYDVDIQQKIPLSQERDMVSDRFLQKVYAEVLNATIDELPENHAADAWAKLAVEDPRCLSDTVAKLAKKRFGDHAVLWSSDTRANERAIGEGYQLISRGTLSEAERDRFEEAGLKHSSQVFGAIPRSPDNVEPTPEMLSIAEFAKALAKELIERDIQVGFYSLPGAEYGAEYDDGQLHFNVANLGKTWFDQAITPHVVGLIVHELGHDRAHDPDFAHGHAYQERESELVGKLALMARDKPDRYKEIFGDSQFRL